VRLDGPAIREPKVEQKFYFVPKNPLSGSVKEDEDVFIRHIAENTYIHIGQNDTLVLGSRNQATPFRFIPCKC
jgi:hypothetical protein